MKSTDTSDHLFFGKSLKSEIAWDHKVSIKFNVFYSTFTNVFLFLSRFFYVLMVFCINLNVFLHVCR